MTLASSVHALRVLVLPILQWKHILLEGGICGTLWGETGIMYWGVRRRSHLIRRVLPQFYTVHAVSLCEFGSCTYGSVKTLQYSWSFIIKSSTQWGLCPPCSNLPCQHQSCDAVEEMHFWGSNLSKSVLHLCTREGNVGHWCEFLSRGGLMTQAGTSNKDRRSSLCFNSLFQFWLSNLLLGGKRRGFSKKVKTLCLT